MKDESRCCGSCRWHKPDDYYGNDWMCCNAESDNCADWTSYNDSCDQWEGRDDTLKRLRDKLGGMDN